MFLSVFLLSATFSTHVFHFKEVSGVSAAQYLFFYYFFVHVGSVGRVTTRSIRSTRSTEGEEHLNSSAGSVLQMGAKMAASKVLVDVDA